MSTNSAVIPRWADSGVPVRVSSTHRCAYCLAVFVALGVDGRPMPVPAWVPGTEREKALERYALRLVEHRKQMDAEASEILGNTI